MWLTGPGEVRRRLVEEDAGRKGEASFSMAQWEGFFVGQPRRGAWSPRRALLVFKSSQEKC